MWLIDQPEQRDAGFINVTADRIDVNIRGQQIGTWPRSDIVLNDRRIHFEIEIRGESLGFAADDPDAFRTYLLGGLAALFEPVRVESTPPVIEPAPTLQPAVGGWWQFWDRSSWNRWSSDRKAWLAYRASEDDLRNRIARATTELAQKQALGAQLRREAAWVSGIALREVPLRLKRGEAGLASVEHVTLMELRKHEGTSVWTAIATGLVHFTDRRMVFSGDKSVTFDFDDINGASLEGVGLHLTVGRRKTSHVLAGPSEQLLVTLNACRSIGAGIDPVPALESMQREANTGVLASQGELANLNQARKALGRPARPFSPAWAPSLVLAAALVGISSIATGQPTPATFTTGLVATPTVTTTTTTQVTRQSTTTTTSIVLVEVMAEVVSVTDGDTIRVLLADGTNEPVRLIGIDAPEPDQPFGPDAAQQLASLLEGQVVQLVADTSDRDQFDRLLRYVYVGDLFVNEAMVDSGLAIAKRYPPDVEMATVLGRAQDRAQSEGRGQWATSTTSAPPQTTTSTTIPSTTTSPPPNTVPSTTLAPPAQNCHSSYTGACLGVGIGDYDCASGTGNGPNYIQGPINVIGHDEFELDRDGDGIACEG
ncbi:MAG: thermonuclease family protein [Acidimicrobiia bacterium]